MILLDELIKYLLVIIPTAVVLFILFMLLIVFKIEKIELFGAKIAKWFSFVGTSFKKKAVAKEVRGRIIELSKSISKEIDGVMPYDLTIKWVKETNRETFFNNGQIIIRMNEKENNTKNISYAVHQYVTNGLLPRAKRYIDPKIIKTTDLAVMRKLIVKGYPEIFDYFCEEYIDPVIKDDNEIEEYLKQIIDLDNNGMFVQVLLREYIDKTNSIFPKEPDDSLKAESKEFLRFLYTITSKEKDENVPLRFKGAHFNVGIIIVAKVETLGNLGYAPYLKRIFDSVEKGTETIYLFAISGIKTEIARNIANIAEEREFRIRSKNEYEYTFKTRNGYKMKGICIVLDTKTKDWEQEVS